MYNSKPYWPNQSTFFLTGATFLHYPYFKNPEQKQMLLNQIKKVRHDLGIPISSYSIAINHYHLKFYLENGQNLAKVKQLINGGTSFEYNKIFKMKYQEMWQSCKTLVITSEEMDWKVTGYIIGNLLKHKEVSNFEELKNNYFCSYWYIAEKYGDDFARQLVYNVIDINEDAEGNINIEKLKGLKSLKPSAKAG